MANDGKLYIVITKDPQTGSGAGGGNSSENKTDKNGILDTIKNIGQNQYFSFAVGQAETIINYSVSNIGNFSGNYDQQRDVQVAISTTKKALSFIGIVGGGIATGGAVGGAVALTLAIISEIVGEVQRINSLVVGATKTNREAERMRDITGLNTLTNGSR